MSYTNYNQYLMEFLPIIILGGIATIFISLALLTSYIIVKQNPNKDKSAPYECGMISFQDARKPFDIRFYLVAILFVMFDIEITLLMPWAVSIKSVGLYAYFSFMLFIFILAVGFIYEWKKGVLEWK